MTSQLLIAPEAIDIVRLHGERDYPAECCGILLGRDEGEKRVIVGARPARNLMATQRQDRYRVDPQDYIEADREAQATGLDIVGFYHSHPDHPAAPSPVDSLMALAFYTYMIVSVTAGTSREVRTWRWEVTCHEWMEEQIRVETSEARPDGRRQ